ncbi:MAG TPA: DUF6186 family protein [Nocardioidaceae bacterium]|jgi:hypothetical protein
MDSRQVTILVYCLLAAGLAVVELVSRRENSRIPSLEVMLRRATRDRATQLALLLAWWWLGWHFMLAI